MTGGFAQGRDRAALRQATREHVEFLYELGIRTYGDLAQSDRNELFQRFTSLRPQQMLDAPSDEQISSWFAQADNELPGTIITPPVR